jgi:transposase
MVGRGELTDTAWATIEPLLPDNGGRGQQWRDHRQVINGILWQSKVSARAPRTCG